jgi:hypothetical protein
MLKKRYAALLCFAACAALPALGITITSTSSYSQWDTSTYITGSPTAVLLSNLTFGTDYSNASGLSDGGYIFTGPDGTNNWSLKASSAQGYYGLLGAQDGIGGINVASPGNAVFVWAVASNNSSDPLNLYINGNFYSTFTTSIGISASSPLTSILVTTTQSSDGVLLSEVDFANSSLTQDSGGVTTPPSQTPEAATLLLVGGGILVVFGTKRKFTNKFAF